MTASVVSIVVALIAEDGVHEIAPPRMAGTITCR
jgi:hypothetical protein